LLPADTFLGRLGRDGQNYDSSGGPTNALRRPQQPQWQDRIYHPKLAHTPPSTLLKGSDGRRIRLHKVYDSENRTPFRPEGFPWTCIGRIEVFEFGQRKRLGTATVVGRRIILTSAHLLPRDGGAGRWAVRFVPGYFDGSSTVGMASWCEAYRSIVHPNNVGDSTQDRDLAILSNWPLAVTIDRYVEAAGWAPFLRAIVVSQRVGVIKPHPAIFAKARRQLGDPEPDAILHVGDDWAADVVGASAVGWRVAYVRHKPGDSPLPSSERDGTATPDLEIDTIAELSDLLAAPPAGAPAASHDPR
jgi:hypothetical protein